jgi:type II secretory pathway predicted ATPase ExeA
MLNKNDLFNAIRTIGIAAGESLPAKLEQTNGFYFIRMQADKTLTPSKMQNLIIKALGGKPIHALEARSRQMKQLIEDSGKKNKRVILIIDGAQFLTPGSLQAIKGISEIIDFGGNMNAGIVLLGEPVALAKILELNQSVFKRTTWFK